MGMHATPSGRIAAAGPILHCPSVGQVVTKFFAVVFSRAAQERLQGKR